MPNTITQAKLYLIAVSLVIVVTLTGLTVNHLLQYSLNEFQKLIHKPGSI